MESNSPPAEKVYEMVLSDDILSPESEIPHHQFADQQALGADFLLSPFNPTLPWISTTRSMENVLLDTSPMEESIDLGSESMMMEHALPISGSGLSFGEEPLPISEQLNEVTLPVVGLSNLEFVNSDLDRSADNEQTEVRFDDIVETPAAEETFLVTQNNTEVCEGIDIVSLSPAPQSLDSIVPSSDNDNAISVDFSSASGMRLADVDDALQVEFVEQKGMTVAESTKSLSKFFENEATGIGTDVEGKSFFDSFTTGDENPITITANPGGPRSLDASQSVGSSVSGSSVSPRVSISNTLPPGPGSLSSPNRRISESSSPHAFQFQPSLSVEATASPTIGNDPFSTGIFSSDVDRRYDAWLPSESTRLVLMSVLTNTTGSSLPAHQTVTPSIIVEESLGDPVHEMARRFLGEQEATKRLVLNADSVPQDEVGLRQLIKAECLRSAVDLTCRLLTQCGQGPGSPNSQANHTTYSLQLWFCRLSLLAKLRLFSLAESEMEQFGDLDTADLYHEYYLQAGPLRRGSMVPFNMRVLHAELPQYVGRSQDTMDRLSYMHSVIKQMVLNLDNGLAEDGSMLELNDSSRQASKELWSAREIRVLYALGNCLLNIKDYVAAVKVYKMLLEKDLPNKVRLLSGIGRVFLQMGDAKVAGEYFDKADAAAADDKLPENGGLLLMNRGLLQLGYNNFSEAYDLFKKVIENDDSNIVAVNNMSVCSLYLGRLKDALQSLESLVYKDPSRHLQEGILLNLCTLYELESSRAGAKKQNLLGLVNQHKGNGFNVACLKLG